MYKNYPNFPSTKSLRQIKIHFQFKITEHLFVRMHMNFCPKPLIKLFHKGKAGFLLLLVQLPLFFLLSTGTFKKGALSLRRFKHGYCNKVVAKKLNNGRAYVN
jgi:hypothetical protein